MRLHLVDGTYELFRAHYSPRPDRSDPDGVDVKATVGVVGSLLNLLEDDQEAVTHVAVAFDNPIESWRNDVFEGYKDGSEVEPALLAQFDRVEDAVRALGVHVWSCDTHEADDALAAAAVQWGEGFDQVRVMTPDKDLGQVVDGQRIVQVDRMREKVYDADGVKDKLGVPPHLVPDYLALVGDTADGIPGLKGFGAKTVGTLLTTYGHLEDLPRSPFDDVDVRGWKRLAATLDDGFEDALLYRRLATLDTTYDVGDVGRSVFDGVPRDEFLSWCDDLAVDGLRDRPTRWRS